MHTSGFSYDASILQSDVCRVMHVARTLLEETPEGKCLSVDDNAIHVNRTDMVVFKHGQRYWIMQEMGLDISTPPVRYSAEMLPGARALVIDIRDSSYRIYSN